MSCALCSEEKREAAVTKMLTVVFSYHTGSMSRATLGVSMMPTTLGVSILPITLGVSISPTTEKATERTNERS